MASCSTIERHGTGIKTAKPAGFVSSEVDYPDDAKELKDIDRTLSKSYKRILKQTRIAGEPRELGNSSVLALISHQKTAVSTSSKQNTTENTESSGDTANIKEIKSDNRKKQPVARRLDETDNVPVKQDESALGNDAPQKDNQQENKNDKKPQDNDPTKVNIIDQNHAPVKPKAGNLHDIMIGEAIDDIVDDTAFIRQHQAKEQKFVDEKNTAQNIVEIQPQPPVQPIAPKLPDVLIGVATDDMANDTVLIPQHQEKEHKFDEEKNNKASTEEAQDKKFLNLNQNPSHEPDFGPVIQMFKPVTELPSRIKKPYADEDASVNGQPQAEGAAQDKQVQAQDSQQSQADVKETKDSETVKGKAAGKNIPPAQQKIANKDKDSKEVAKDKKSDGSGVPTLFTVFLLTLMVIIR